MSKTLIAAAVVTVVILTECALAYVLIPSPAQLEAHLQTQAHAPAETKSAAHGKDHGKEHGKEAEKESATLSDKGTGEKPEAEVDLGKFNLIIHQPASNLTLRVNFHLVGTVVEEEKEAFNALLAKNQHRLRDQVIFEVRSCELSELTDPGLALIKRKILAKSNELLGKPLLKTVVFSEFAFIEQ